MTTRVTSSSDDLTLADEIQLDDGRRIHATVEDGFGQIVDVFVANFVERHDLSAGCAVYVDGRGSSTCGEGSPIHARAGRGSTIRRP